MYQNPLQDNRRIRKVAAAAEVTLPAADTILPQYPFEIRSSPVNGQVVPSTIFQDQIGDDEKFEDLQFHFDGLMVPESSVPECSQNLDQKYSAPKSVKPKRKNPNEPKKPPSAYLIFKADTYDNVKRSMSPAGVCMSHK